MTYTKDKIKLSREHHYIVKDAVTGEVLEDVINQQGLRDIGLKIYVEQPKTRNDIFDYKGHSCKIERKTVIVETVIPGRERKPSSLKGKAAIRKERYSYLKCDGIKKLGIKVPEGFKEEFKRVVDLIPDCTNPFLYVSNAGYVYNASRGTFPGFYNIDRTGYKGFTMHFYNKKDQLVHLHQLVALAFCDKPVSDSKLVVNHKDEDKLNNVCTNLEWCTYAYNSNYGSAIARGSESKKLAWERSHALGDMRNGMPVKVTAPDGTVTEYSSVCKACNAIGSKNAGAITARLNKSGTTKSLGYTIEKIGFFKLAPTTVTIKKGDVTHTYNSVFDAVKAIDPDVQSMSNTAIDIMRKIQSEGCHKGYTFTITERTSNE